jgi:lysophospholipase L1-like esterase
MLNRISRSWIARALFGVLVMGSPEHLLAQSPQVLDPNATRYMALGDSIAAGYKMAPVTQAYPYLLYQGGAFDRMPRTLFNNLAAVGATSQDVLVHQVPQALIPVTVGGFGARYITLTVGGNDILAVLRFALTHQNDPLAIAAFTQTVLAQYTKNLTGILGQLRGSLPGVKIFVANQYTIPELDAIAPGVDQIIGAFNAATHQVVGVFPSNVFEVDVFGAFIGRQNLIQLERHGASLFEVHPTSVGHQVIAKAFEDVIDEHK